MVHYFNIYYWGFDGLSNWKNAGFRVRNEANLQKDIYIYIKKKKVKGKVV